MASAPLVGLPRWAFVAVSLTGLVLLGLAATGVLDTRAWIAQSGDHDTSVAVRRAARDASGRMARAAQLVYAAKRRAGVFVDAGAPAAFSAFVGSEITPLVTTLGSLDAKRTSASPAWAERLTREFASRGVARDTVVAATFSGSFPALNVAVICAAESLGASVVAVSSVTASAWGATDPGFTWPEIEVLLAASKTITPASVAISTASRQSTPLR